MHPDVGCACVYEAWHEKGTEMRVMNDSCTELVRWRVMIATVVESGHVGRDLATGCCAFRRYL